MLKKLRKLSNMTILCITNNAQFKDDIFKNLKENKELTFADSYDESILDKMYDILLIDFDFENALDIMNKIRISKPLLPKIVALGEQTEKNIVACINAGSYSIISKNINYEDLRLSLIMALNQSKRVDKICLDNDIYYDSYRERFYDSFGEISFTKFEFQVLKLLLDNSDKIIGYEDIKKNVWKDKKMSIFTMRNVINKIRNKTYYGIIRNSSSAGYQIDTLK